MSPAGRLVANKERKNVSQVLKWEQIKKVDFQSFYSSSLIGFLDESQISIDSRVTKIAEYQVLKFLGSTLIQATTLVYQITAQYGIMALGGNCLAEK